MKQGDRVKTTAWLGVTNEDGYLLGTVYQITNQSCLDGTTIEMIYIKFDDGRFLPCIRQELELLEK
jgi:hypothetical protein